MRNAKPDVVTANLAVTIVRWVDAHQPGWVETQFTDTEGKRHTFVDKVPGFTDAPLGPDSIYPQPGQIRCAILSESSDASGRTSVRISTARPYDIESTEGLTEFVVLSTQLSGRAAHS